MVSEAYGFLLAHLPRVEDTGTKATSARLLSSAINSFTASLEVARHGYPRQYGALARMTVETLATVVVLVTKDDGLERFYADDLASTKCIGWANKLIPIFGPLNGLFSNEFVHIGTKHALLELPKKYRKSDEEVEFLKASLVSVAWLIRMVTELIYADEISDLKYWKRQGGGFLFEPNNESNEWLDDFFLVKN